MSETPSGDTEPCKWCHNAPGDAIRGVDICDDCLDRFEIPPRMISGQMKQPVKITDGGKVERLNQEEIDTVVSELMREPQTSVAVVSAVRKLDDIGAGSGQLPDSFEIGCQKCGDPIEEGDEYLTRFGYYYCLPCIERIGGPGQADTAQDGDSP